MKNHLLAILISMFALNCNASAQLEKTTFLYDGHTFFIPKNPLTIACAGDDENTIILKYSNEKWKKYISFSNPDKNKSFNTSCTTKEFLDQAFSASESRNCSRTEVDNFRKIFIDGSDSGVLKSDQTTTYYSINSITSFLFIINHNNLVTKIDTDFISKEELKELVAETRLTPN